ncbi:hypothetical protein [Actinoplanes sichuanensis]|uniref:Uncharacterized protein n=1 Tax=Actinoplanes sichuanensis TaxID=512349 RepID=A0ABW4AT86_9ACTN|nr:hypothetical protein [Actinoplanes sichuanensis]
MNTTRGITLAWLGHPVTMVALAVLVVNDHVLKAVHPGWVTGKLSDAAGMLLAPPLLAALAGLIAPRLPLRPLAITSIVTIGVGFTFVKLWVYGARLASATWSLVTPSLIRADPTDLLVLPLLAATWWTLGRSRTTRAGRVTRAVRLAVLMPLALAGVAATSPLPRPLAQEVAVDDGALYVRVGRDDWWVSRDEARTWAASAAPRSPESPACSQGRICYRVVPAGLGVQSSVAGGPWTDSWRVSEGQRRALYHDYGDADSLGDLTSDGLAVLDGAAGHVVVVANGRDGFAVRDAIGRWERIGFPRSDGGSVVPPLSADPSPDPPSTALVITVISLLAGFLMTVTGVLSLRRSGQSRHWWWLVALLPVSAIMLLPLVVLGWLEPNSLIWFPVFVCTCLAVMVSLVGACVAVSRSEVWAASRRDWSRSTAVAALLTVAVSVAAWWVMS